MANKYISFNKTINDIVFRMLRKNDNCWIKIEPTNRESSPSSLHIILNGEDYHWDIYDDSGREAHIIYFKGCKIAPSFYLKSGKTSFRVNCDYDKIHVIPITESHTMNDYIKNYCRFLSQDASCWANAIYYSKRPDKPPFDKM